MDPVGEKRPASRARIIDAIAQTGASAAELAAKRRA
jgi:hypothetical protein